MNGMSIGWESIPTYKVVSAAGAVEKVNVWTAHVMVTEKVFVIEATPG